jgi:sigma-B regulation protein RsbU (phosphoserine phosphatase)
VLYRVVDKGIAAPIQKLNAATHDLVNNLDQKKDFVVDISTGDEIEALADSFCRMDIEIKDYLTQLSAITAEKERIGAELDVARHIQSSMLPCIFPPFPDRKEFDIYATMTPAKEVGGDFYDFFMVDPHHLAVVMADVSGKGVPAALFMVIAKTLIKDHTTPGADLGAVFTTVNELLCESNSEGLFVTAFEGVLDLVTGEFRFVNAGHEMPYLCKAGGQYELRKLRPGFVLAGMEGMRYRSGSFMMEPGDKFFQYTDGVTEATNAGNDLYGQARLTETLNQHTDDEPMELLPAIKADIDRFVGAAPQFDDITMLSLVYKERMEASV